MVLDFKALRHNSWTWGALLYGCGLGLIMVCADSLQGWFARRKPDRPRPEIRPDEFRHEIRKGLLPEAAEDRHALRAELQRRRRELAPARQPAAILCAFAVVTLFPATQGGGVRLAAAAVTAAALAFLGLGEVLRRKRLTRMQRLLCVTDGLGQRATA